MLEHDSRGIQFPGHDPARTCGQHALLLAFAPGFLHCVLFDCNDGPHFIVRSRHSLRERCNPEIAPMLPAKARPCSVEPPVVCAVASWFGVGQDN